MVQHDRGYFLLMKAVVLNSKIDFKYFNSYLNYEYR